MSLCFFNFIICFTWPFNRLKGAFFAFTSTGTHSPLYADKELQLQARVFSHNSWCHFSSVFLYFCAFFLTKFSVSSLFLPENTIPIS